MVDYLSYNFNSMIPGNKQLAVKKALRAAFNVDAFDSVQQLTKGLSNALVFKIIVHENPYLLRVVTRTDTLADPSFYYGCMKVAAEKKVAPRIHYLSINERVSITDFITEQPFLITAAKELMPHLLRKLHALPKFPFRINYFETMEKFILQFRSTKVLPENEMKDLIEIYQRIAHVYPQHDVDNWVSCHNDSKPENIIFDGQRPWFIDWESAFLNDLYLDLAIVANFIVFNEKDEDAYLEAYFREALDEYKYARFFLMQEILHFYYCIFLIVFYKGEKPIDITNTVKRSFREFHNGIWNGEINLAETATKLEYAILHLHQFRMKAETLRFEESLQIVSRHSQFY